MCRRKGIVITIPGARPVCWGLHPGLPSFSSFSTHNSSSRYTVTNKETEAQECGATCPGPHSYSAWGPSANLDTLMPHISLLPAMLQTRYAAPYAQARNPGSVFPETRSVSCASRLFNSRAYGLLFASIAKKFSHNDGLTFAVGSTRVPQDIFVSAASFWQNLFSFILM